MLCAAQRDLTSEYTGLKKQMDNTNEGVKKELISITENVNRNTSIINTGIHLLKQ